MKEYIVQAIAQETIDSFDAHNAPELIRCKDCKHAKPLNEEYLGCSCLVDGIDSDYVMTVKPYSYCSWAERR